MRIPSTRALAHSSLVVAAAAALPLTLAAPAAHAAGITVTANGSTVTATTTSCQNGGNGSLLAAGQADFAQGRQMALSSGSVTWTGVSSGTYTAVVVCADGSTAGTQSVTVSASPTISATSSPLGGVRGGLGGGSEDYGTLTYAAGGTLVAAALVGGVWYLRRRRT
ncbi:hypothetical protein GTY65_09885 [Streptomyces sp. SID8379]|uniref:hypothetical protein n=1 Tax=unclassified Streptomyces TaxID=2593676 RepID=UPI0005B9597A|nr:MULTISPECIES: hypothetical protein [unclassified Streptomyces]MYW64379.1 hypothetical protein [Streptomyces sp. SID8379]